MAEFGIAANEIEWWFRERIIGRNVFPKETMKEVAVGYGLKDRKAKDWTSFFFTIIARINYLLAYPV